jgi:hypothetical protein
MREVRKILSNSGCRQNVILQDRSRKLSPCLGHTVGCGNHIFVFGRKCGSAWYKHCQLRSASDSMWIIGILRASMFVLATLSEMKVHTAFLRENSSYPRHVRKGVQCSEVREALGDGALSYETLVSLI